MVSYKTPFHTGTRKIKVEKAKQSQARKGALSSDTVSTDADESSINYLFNNKMNRPNPMMSQGYPNQYDPMMGQGYLNQYDPMMGQGYPNPQGPMMGQGYPNQQGPVMMGNSTNQYQDQNIDALSIQTFAPVKNPHNGKGNAISNLGLLNNNMNNPIYTESEMSQPNYPGMPHPGMQYPGMNHAGMNHAGMNHAGMNHAGMNHPGMQYPGMNHAGINYGAIAPQGEETNATETYPNPIENATETYPNPMENATETYPDNPTAQPDISHLGKLKL